jgi:hypothetical protein
MTNTENINIETQAFAARLEEEYQARLVRDADRNKELARELGVELSKVEVRTMFLQKVFGYYLSIELMS